MTALTAPAADLMPLLSTLIALVVSIENTTTPSPTETAFHEAIRWKGEDLLQVGGPEALKYALAFIRDQAPAKAERRETILDEAWSGLPGWRS